MDHLKSPPWLAITLVVLSVAGMAWQYLSLRVPWRQKSRMLLGLVLAAGLITVISAAKRFQVIEAVLIYADAMLGLAVGLLFARSELARAEQAEARGIRIEVAKGPVYRCLAVTFAVFVSLLLAEYFIFG
jgi:uncharacterized membrane protein AbrB (regulator of aidB expression)